MNKTWTRDEARKHIVEVLRSGKYEQTTGQLKKGNKYCCLGVMTEEFSSFGIQLHGGLVNNEVTNLLGLIDNCGNTKRYKGKGTIDDKALYRLNDHYKLSFPQIADALETGEYWE